MKTHQSLIKQRYNSQNQICEFVHYHERCYWLKFGISVFLGMLYTTRMPCVWHQHTFVSTTMIGIPRLQVRVLSPNDDTAESLSLADIEEPPGRRD